MNVNMDSEANKSLHGLQPNYQFINQFATNPIMIGVLFFIIIIYYFVINSSMKSDTYTPGLSDVSGQPASSKSLSLLEIFLWALFIGLLVLNGIRYFYDLDITTSIQNIFSKEPEIDINVTSVSGEPIKPDPDPVPEIREEKQVFHVAENNYGFEDARAICAAYGSKLASYDDIEKAYNDGGEWCGFGWSADQMALYPTQKKTFDKLQKIKGHEHDCGRPGVNGGYIANPNVKFGVNCYGYKPKITAPERKLMELQQMYPKTKKELTFEKKVYEWRRKLSEILVSPFNKTNWSQPLWSQPLWSKI
jgi:hypothetical protein